MDNEQITPEQKVLHDACHECYAELIVIEKEFLALQEKYNKKKGEYEAYLFQVQQINLS